MVIEAPGSDPVLENAPPLSFSASIVDMDLASSIEFLDFLAYKLFQNHLS